MSNPEIKYTWSDHDYDLDNDGFLDVSIEIQTCPAVPKEELLKTFEKLVVKARGWLEEL